MTNTTNFANSPNRPAYDALVREEIEGADKSTWRKIGAAWTGKDANGFNLVLSELPFTPDGKKAIYLRASKVPKLAEE